MPQDQEREGAGDQAGVRVAAPVDAVGRHGERVGRVERRRPGRARRQHGARADAGEVAQAQRDGRGGRRRAQRVVREQRQDQAVEGGVETGDDGGGRDRHRIGRASAHDRVEEPAQRADVVVRRQRRLGRSEDRRLQRAAAGADDERAPDGVDRHRLRPQCTVHQAAGVQRRERVGDVGHRQQPGRARHAEGVAEARAVRVALDRQRRALAARGHQDVEHRREARVAVGLVAARQQLERRRHGPAGRVAGHLDAGVRGRVDAQVARHAAHRLERRHHVVAIGQESVHVAGPMRRLIPCPPRPAL